MSEGPMPGEAFFCSWSGGKDSCLALYRATAAGAKPAYLVTMLIEDGTRSRSHGLAAGVIRAQAASLGIPPLTRACSWKDYEASFIGALRELRARGVQAGVFGDIDIDRHRAWEESVCEAAGLRAYLPLWRGERRALLAEFLRLGFEAKIVATNAGALGAGFLGRTLDSALVEELSERGVDPCGENGEYHTVVTGGPMFAHRLVLEAGEATLRDGYWFLDFALRANP